MKRLNFNDVPTKMFINFNEFYAFLVNNDVLLNCSHMFTTTNKQINK